MLERLELHSVGLGERRKLPKNLNLFYKGAKRRVKLKHEECVTIFILYCVRNQSEPFVTNYRSLFGLGLFPLIFPGPPPPSRRQKKYTFCRILIFVKKLVYINFLQIIRVKRRYNITLCLHLRQFSTVYTWRTHGVHIHIYKLIFLSVYSW